MPFWPFANGWMLLWGLAAAAPIIIHLWNRRRHREVTWAAMEYLLAALRNNARRLRIEQLILLAVRTLILILLAVALADPLLRGLPLAGRSAGGGGNTHYVIVVDGSYSMQYLVDGETCFDRAKKLAATLVGRTAQGDGMTLVLMSDPPRIVVAQAAFDPADMLDELDRLAVSHGGAELASALAEIESVVDANRQRYPRLDRAKVCFFTDLGRNTWKEVETDAVRAAIGRLAGKASLVQFDVGRSPAQNLAITSAAVEPLLATVMDDVVLRAEITNFGTQDWIQHPVELFVGGHKMGEQRVDVRSGRTAAVAFDHRFSTAGAYGLEVRLGADPLELDNHWWTTVTVRDRLRVLCIEGSPGAARYVAWALDPSRPERARVATELAAENALVESDLSAFDCVWVCNVASLGRGEQRALHQYVARGGGLVVSLGDRTELSSFEATGDSDTKAPAVLAGAIEALAPTGNYAVDPLDYAHPVVGVFRGNERSGLLTTPVWKYVRCRPADGANTVLALDSRDPFILELAIGRGRSMLVTTAVSPASMDRTTVPPTPWSALSTWPSFPPLVQELLAFAVRGRAVHRNVTVGEPLSGWSAVSAANLQITTPAGRTERLAASMDGGALRWTHTDTSLSGFYELATDDDSAPAIPLAVNLDGRESSLERMDPALMPDQFARELDDTPAESQVPDVQLAIDAPQHVFRQCLALVLVLLLAELFLAWFFGNAT